jgi:hypothetical protein
MPKKSDVRPKSRDWIKYPLRVCRFLNECSICLLSIYSGERYRDGGYGRRAHEKCVEHVNRLKFGSG